MIWLLATLGCGLGPETQDSFDACESREVPLTYANFGEPFLERHCTACHGSYLDPSRRSNAPQGIDLDSYADALTFKERIQARVLDPESPEMPPGGGPTDLELQRLQEWLDCGLGAE